jgi:hypothetical protein
LRNDQTRQPASQCRSSMAVIFMTVPPTLFFWRVGHVPKLDVSRWAWG